MLMEVVEVFDEADYALLIKGWLLGYPLCLAERILHIVAARGRSIYFRNAMLGALVTFLRLNYFCKQYSTFNLVLKDSSSLICLLPA